MTKDSREAYLEKCRKEFPKNDVPLADRLATPEGKKLVAELEHVLAAAVLIVQSNDEAQPMLFASPKDETVGALILPLVWGNDAQRSQIYSAAKLAFLAYDVQSYVTVSEGWSCEEKHYDPNIRNVDNPHRVEVLSVIAVSRDLSIGKHMEIIVDENGDRKVRPWPTDMKDEGTNGINETAGDMAGLLPPKEITGILNDEDRQRLRERLPFKLEPITESFGQRVN
jgi:hypothetical protein